MSGLKEASEQCDHFKNAFGKGDLQTCTRLLSSLKLTLTSLPALPPFNEQTATAQQELAVARDVLEHAVLLSIKVHDQGLFERNFAQLRTFYSDTRDRMPPSEKEYFITALNLMRLLVQNRIAEFHTELELIPKEAQSNTYIKHTTQLEQYLMEGAYHKVLASRSSVPDESFAYFMESLTSTVREEIASCSEKAYRLLHIRHAKEMMLFSSDAEVLSYAKERGWEVRDGAIVFCEGSREAGCKEIPSLELINYTLTYAKELERIV